jgi:CRP/FNR family cyclic AMP-dependent transcriptional regulator
LGHYGHQDILAHQGDVGAKLWIVLAGRAQLQIIGMDGQTKLLASHGTGELFGAFPSERIVISNVVVHNRLSAHEVATANMTRLLQQ